MLYPSIFADSIKSFGIDVKNVLIKYIPYTPPKPGIIKANRDLLSPVAKTNVWLPTAVAVPGTTIVMIKNVNNTFLNLKSINVNA